MFQSDSEPDLFGLLLPLFGDPVPDLGIGEPDLDLDPALEPDLDREGERDLDLDLETLRDFAEPAGDLEDGRDPTDSFDLGDLDRERDFLLDSTDTASE